MSIKPTMFALALFALSSSINAQTQLSGPFTLTVDLSQTKVSGGKIIVYHFNPVSGPRYGDTVNITSTTTLIKGELQEPELVNLLIEPTDKSQKISNSKLSIYLSPGDIKVIAKDSLPGSTIIGDPLQKDYSTLVEKQKLLNKPFAILSHQHSEAVKQNDTTKAKELWRQMWEVKDNIVDKSDDSLYKAYVHDNGHTTPVALYVLTLYKEFHTEELAKVQQLLQQLAHAYQQLPTAQKLSNLIATVLNTAVGQYAPDFTQNDTLGHPVTLSSFKGQYVLVDFWASWCGPCRAENHNVVKAWQQYKDKGFTVLSVSFDNPGDYRKWLKAIHDDRLTWTNVWDQQTINGPLGQAYGIQGIPKNFLLDKDGKIIAKNLRGDELGQKLAMLLN